MSPDCKVIATGSADGTIKFWDTVANKLLKSLRGASPGHHPICLAFNPQDLCVAAGTTNKMVRYWELSEFGLVSSTSIENSQPRFMQFEGTGELTFAAFDDCTKSFNLDFEGMSKPKVFECIAKPSLKRVLDMKISSDSKNLYLLETNYFEDEGSRKNKPTKLELSHLLLDDCNKDPKVNPYRKEEKDKISFNPGLQSQSTASGSGFPRQSEMSQRTAGANHPSVFPRRNNSEKRDYAAESTRGKAPSVFAANALSLIG